MFNKKYNELLEKIDKVDKRLSRLIRHLDLVEKTIYSTPACKIFITAKEYHKEQMADLEATRKIYDHQNNFINLSRQGIEND